MKIRDLLLQRLLAGRKAGKNAGGGPGMVLQILLGRLLRRSPIGFLGTILLRKALTGDGRVFGMDLVSRRKARWNWLMTLLQAHLAKRGPAPVRRSLSR